MTVACINEKGFYIFAFVQTSLTFILANNLHFLAYLFVWWLNISKCIFHVFHILFSFLMKMLLLPVDTDSIAEPVSGHFFMSGMCVNYSQ